MLLVALLKVNRLIEIRLIYCTIVFLVYSQTYAANATNNFRTFSSPQKETLFTLSSHPSIHLLT